MGLVALSPDRDAQTFAPGPLGQLFDLLLAAVEGMLALFGLHHFSQGVTGVTENIIDGAILGGLYLATGRNLLAPIIAHGVTDTVDVLLIYSGHYPGMS